MIPALATIVAAYVVFRCISITLDSLDRVSNHALIRGIAFVIIVFGAAGVMFLTIIEILAINTAATEVAF